MSFGQALYYAVQAINAQRLRTLLILLAMAIGVASVLLLTALGDSARRYITDEFSALGTNLLIVLPGRSETTGGPPPLLGETPRDLTLDDALAIERSRYIDRVAPIIVGSAPVSYGGLEREVNILGSTADLLEVRHLDVAQGSFLPAIDPKTAMAVCVIGYKLRLELFPQQRAIGRWLRIGDRRFRVIGVLRAEGQSIGVDFDDLAIIPVASAQALFDTHSLFRVLSQASSKEVMHTAAEDLRAIVKQRHEGEDDITVITQDSVVATFDAILQTLTLALGGIAGISLGVAGILIMNVMLVSVAQRTAEIGLLKAIGANKRQITHLFVVEAGILSLAGASLGIAAGMIIAVVVDRIYTSIDFTPPLWAILAALAVSLLTGTIFGLLPARRAAKLDPVLALSRH